MHEACILERSMRIEGPREPHGQKRVGVGVVVFVLWDFHNGAPRFCDDIGPRDWNV